MTPQLQSMLQQAIKAFQDGNFEGADSTLKRVLQVDKKNLPALHVLGLIKASQENYIEAADFLGRAARINPNDASIQYNLAKALSDCGLDIKSMPHHKKAVQLSVNNPEAWLNYGKSASSLGRYDEALGCYDKALSLNPNYGEAALNKGATFKAQGKYEEALVLAERALEIRPNFVEACRIKGLILSDLKRFDEAIAQFDKTLGLKPDDHELWLIKGVLLHRVKRYEEAITHFDKALNFKPDYHEAWANKGVILHELKRFDEAMAYYDTALDLNPSYHVAWTNKGVTLHELKSFDEAITHFNSALNLMPDYQEAWTNKGVTLNFLKRHSESAGCYLKALKLQVGDSYLLGQVHHQMLLTCDWTDYEENVTKLLNLTNEGRKGGEPFGLLGIANSEEMLRKCAEIYSNDKFPALSNLSESSKFEHKKIRIGYLCSEFRSHATSILMAGVWELHSKSEFEIFAFDNGWDDGSEYRQRIEGAFEAVLDISRLPDEDAARLIKSYEIDILVNLNGFFGLARPGIFSYKPAPIQVNYLGFPGTIGSKYIDYIIADKVVLPNESKQYYVEKVVHLPNSYQANDNLRIISERSFTKTELGLPENGFVFACFNNNYKITPATFESWVRILKHVPQSVLWLLADNPMAQENLVKEAVSRGIDATRLIFAERFSVEDHLARHNLADLFLDTLPCNAHTTCSDALWAGLPVLTLMGSAFSGRVAASLLTAVELPELIASSEEQYEAMAVELANNPQKLSMIKQVLVSNRLTAPLFDTPRHTKNIEAAYIKMYERYQADLSPEDINI